MRVAKQRGSIICSVLVMLLLGLVYWGGPPAALAAKKEVVFWNTLTQKPRVDAMKQVIAAFEKAHPDITVRMELVPWVNAAEKFVTAIAARTTPDVSTMGMGWPIRYWLMGATVPVDEIIDSIGRANLADGAKTMCTYQNQFICIPFYNNPMLLFYRKDVFAELNLKVPETWDEMLTAAKAINAAKAPEMYGYGIGASEALTNTTALIGWLFSNGAYILGKNGEVIFNSPEMVQTYEFVLKLIREGSVPGVEALERNEVTEMFASGRIAMNVDSAFFGHRYFTAFPGKVGAILPPSRTKQRPVPTSVAAGPVELVVWKGDAEPEAKAFLKFLFKDKTLVPYFLSMPGAMHPFTLSSWKTDAWRTNPVLHSIQEIEGAVEQGNAMSAVIGNVYGVFMCSGELEASIVLPRVLSRMLALGESPAEAVKWGDTYLKKKVCR
jgi:multiple sugar transport system substrate-binding protein